MENKYKLLMSFCEHRDMRQVVLEPILQQLKIGLTGDEEQCTEIHAMQNGNMKG